VAEGGVPIAAAARRFVPFPRTADARRSCHCHRRPAVAIHERERRDIGSQPSELTPIDNSLALALGPRRSLG